jgi:hypothetical protein
MSQMRRFFALGLSQKVALRFQNSLRRRTAGFRRDANVGNERLTAPSAIEFL